MDGDLPSSILHPRFRAGVDQWTAFVETVLVGMAFVLTVFVLAVFVLTGATKVFGTGCSRG
jgi:hypothetical protein